MRPFLFPTSVSVILISLLGTDQVYARPSEDAFGITNYGFQCSNRIYRKFEIYAAAKKLCDTMGMKPNVKNEISVEREFRYPWVESDQKKFRGIPEPPYFLQPILNDGILYPIDLPTELRKVQDKNGEISRIDPGPDRIMISKDCRVLDIFSDVNYHQGGHNVKIVRCTPLPFSGSRKRFSRHRPVYVPVETSTRSPDHFSPENHSPEVQSPGHHSPGQQSPDYRVPSYRSPGHQSPDTRSSGHQSPENRSPSRHSSGHLSPGSPSPELQSPTH